jgi:hypothetical protein
VAGKKRGEGIVSDPDEYLHLEDQELLEKVGRAMGVALGEAIGRQMADLKPILSAILDSIQALERRMRTIENQLAKAEGA